MKYQVLKKLNDLIYEDFGTYTTFEEAELAAKIIKAFIGGEFLIKEDKQC